MHKYKNKILIVIDNYVDPALGGGVASWAIDLKNEFKKQKVWCEVAGYYKVFSEYDINGVSRVEKNNRLIKIIEREGIKVVISGISYSAFHIWRIINDNVIKIATIHGASELEVKKELLAQKVVDAFICVSEPVKEIARKYNPNKPVYIVNNGVNLSTGNLGDYKKKDMIIWLGRIEIDTKRAHWLKYIVRIINRHGYTLHIIGGKLGGNKIRVGFVEDWLMVNIKNNNVVWYKEISRKEVEKLIKRAKAILSTSYYEGLSISFLEGMKYGCVVIAPDLNRVKSGILNKDNAILYKVGKGIFFKQNYNTEIEKAIQRLRGSDVERINKFAYQTLVEECSLEKNAAKYLKIIDELEIKKSTNLIKTNTFIYALRSLQYRKFMILHRNFRKIRDRIILKLEGWH